jgi:hypothetical protein
MLTSGKLACLVILLLCLFGTVAGTVQAAALKQQSDCKVMPFASIARVIGQLSVRYAPEKSPVPTLGKWRGCEAQSSRWHIKINAYCHMPPSTVPTVFSQYGRQPGARPLKNLGDQASYVVMANDPETGGKSQALVVRKDWNVFYIDDVSKTSLLPIRKLLELAKLAVHYNCA